jgi:hypothetical protein
MAVSWNYSKRLLDVLHEVMSVSEVLDHCNDTLTSLHGFAGVQSRWK